MFETVRWGILGTGSIARKFATGLGALADAELVAVGSRTAESASRFADEFAIPARHASYAALAADPTVDAIYIATPHTLHKENMLLCLNAGKAVLCEKPFTINASEAQEAINLARARGLFLMEAMWTRYLPLMVELRHRLADGQIGEIRMISADFGYRAAFNPERRTFDPALGGGALLDVGVYPISLASMLLGAPSRIVSLAELGETGVDEQSAMILGYPGGELAVLHTAVRTQTPHDATIMGTAGSIRIHTPWWVPRSMTISVAGEQPELVEIPFEGNGYNYEAAELHTCLREGKHESAIMPLDETLQIMQTMDTIRGQWGMKYPME
ncbi:MAG: Gfo/Idh/MocA family oxidoreductase [Caldilineaceae bacterium]|nr:Gfo/Idh/MocA family oxidoreductase [Caldilineaceae bacterium]